VTSNFGYDAIYELTSVLQGANTTESYTYDPVGNRLSSLSVSPYSYNASNELTSTPNATYGYDLDGNAVTKNDSTGITTYAWDFENRLTSVTLPAGGGTVTFAYDPFGRRIEKASSAGTSIYAYDGDNLVEETNSSGAVVARYSQGLNIDEPLAMLRSGATDFYEADGLGSVTSLTSAAGALAQTYTFDSFGKQTASSGSLTNPFQYTGREFDPETSLYYYRARYYDPSSSRFLTEDPIGFSGSFDFYLYSDDSPVGLKDPTGLGPQGWPVPGSSTPFPRPGEPPRPHRRKPYNCMAHGLGIADKWMQPETPWGPLNPYMHQHGCKEVPCDAAEPCGGKRHRVNTYEDPLRPWNWHVERQDCDGFWSSKDGQGPLVIGITNPDDFYQKIYGPVFNPKKTCWSCKGK